MKSHSVSITKEKLIELRSSGLTKAQISEQLECTTAAVDYWVKKFNLQRRYLKRDDEIKFKKLAEQHTQSELAEIYNVDTRTIQGWLKKMQIKAARSANTRRIELDKDYIRRKFLAGFTSAEIAEDLGVSKHTILDRLHEDSELSELAWQKDQKWRKDIKRYYGVYPETDDKPGTVGKDCMKKHMASCKYCSGGDCMYLAITGHRRPSPPWNCKEYERKGRRRENGWNDNRQKD